MQAHQLRSQAADRRRHTLFAGKLYGAIEILEQRPHMPFHRFEAAFGHLRGEDLQRFGISETAGQGVGDQASVHPRLFRQGHHFGDHQCIAGDDHLVAGLGHLTRAHAAHMGNALAQ